MAIPEMCSSMITSSSFYRQYDNKVISPSGVYHEPTHTLTQSQFAGLHEPTNNAHREGEKKCVQKVH